MKNLLVLVLVLAFAAIAPLGLSHDKSQKPPKGERVNCCHGKGNCDNLHTREDCEKDGGKVVKHCRECK